MRCKACNVLLSDYEATRKNDNGFIDLCNYCYKSVCEDVPSDLDSNIIDKEVITYNEREFTNG